MKFSQFLIQLDEAKTPQLIGYHATTYGGAYAIKRDGVLKANPKNARWNHGRGQGIVSLKDSVYVELDPAKALLWYGDEMSSGLVIIEFTEKTALADPQYDIKAFILNFIFAETKNFSDILDFEKVESKLSVEELANWCEERIPAFRKQFHEYLSKGNERVPDKTEQIVELLFYTILHSKPNYFNITDEQRKHISNKHHELLKNVSELYKGFKRNTSTAMRIPHDIEFTGRNRIIGILTSPIGTRARTGGGYDREYKSDEELSDLVKRVTYEVIWGNPKEIREKTGLIALGNREDRDNYFWERGQKQKAEKERKAKEMKKQKDKERRAAKKAAMNKPETL
jgi:hypothetical protein